MTLRAAAGAPAVTGTRSVAPAAQAAEAVELVGEEVGHRRRARRREVEAVPREPAGRLDAAFQSASDELRPAGGGGAQLVVGRRVVVGDVVLLPHRHDVVLAERRLPQREPEDVLGAGVECSRVIIWSIHPSNSGGFQTG